jgi:hypothetical protein
MITLADHELIEDLLTSYDVSTLAELILKQNKVIVKLQDENDKLTSFVSPHILNTIIYKDKN